MIHKHFDFFRYDNDFYKDVKIHPKDNIALYIQYVIARNTDTILQVCEIVDDINDNTGSLENRLNDILKAINEIKDHLSE